MNPATPLSPGIVPDLRAATLRVRHETRYAHGAPVALAHHLAHLRPRETPRQSVADWQLQIAPEPDGGDVAIEAGRDVFGNWRHSFSHTRVHDRLTVVSSFVATPAPRRCSGPRAALGAGRRSTALPGRGLDARGERVRAGFAVCASGEPVRAVRRRPVRAESAGAGGGRRADAPHPRRIRVPRAQHRRGDRCRRRRCACAAACARTSRT